MREKPRHVKVAEAVGWEDVAFRRAPVRCGGSGGTYNESGWYGRPPGYDGLHLVDGFDQSWRVTGPLIEEYGIELLKQLDGSWTARLNPRGRHPLSATGRDVLVVVCELILHARERGILTAPQ